MFNLPYGEGKIEFSPSNYNIDNENIEYFSASFSNNKPIDSKKIKNKIKKNIKPKLKSSKLNKDKVISVVISDKSRPVPNEEILSVLLPELLKLGVKKKNIYIIVATGKHEKHERDDFIELTNKYLVDNYNFISHDYKKNTLFKSLGETSNGIDLKINKYFVEADYRIITGLIDIHQFAGFTGGAKSVTIGLGSPEFIDNNHKLMEKENAVPGKYKNNPVRKEIEEIYKFIDIDLAINVILDQKNRLLEVFSGPPQKVHKKGRELLYENSKIIVKNNYDISIISAGGYPKDINLYQAQKALKHVEPIMKKDGVIILIAKCQEGYGDDKFKKALNSNYKKIIEKFKNSTFEVGPHKAYLYASTLSNCEVFLVAKHFKDNFESSMLPFEVFDSLKKALSQALAKFNEKRKIALVPKASSIIFEKEEH